MPQAAVPDINVAIIRAREHFLKGLEFGNFDQVLDSIYFIVGLLDDELKPKFLSYKQYQEKIAPIILVKCPECSNRTELREIDMRTQNLSTLKCQVLKLKRTTRIVKCQECNIDIDIDDSNITTIRRMKSKYEQEFISEPPPIATLYQRAMNTNQFRIWARHTWSILEDRCRQFRNMATVSEDEEDDS